MASDSLRAFIGNVRSAWGALSPELVAHCRSSLEMLARADRAEPWLATLLRERPASQEVYRDPEHGFVLLAHAEDAGLYRPPHDHGRSWVVYAVAEGRIDMGAYERIEDPDLGVRLEKRSSTIVQPGQALAYLPGDIHDTRCISDALLFRFTERDLRVEDRQEGRVTRYHQRNGVWTV